MIYMYLVNPGHELCRLLRDRISCEYRHDEPTEENGDDSREGSESYLYGCISMQRYWSSLRYSFLRTLFLLAADLRRHPTTV